MCNRVFYWLIASFIATSCIGDNDKMRKAMMEEYKRLRTEYESEQKESCRLSLLLLAEKSVDSIILTMQINPIRDSLYSPDVPTKPKFVPVDSTVFIDSVDVGPSR